MQLSLFDIPQPKIELNELFEAYFECRKNKRYTANALVFEIDYEHNLVHPVGHLSNGVKLCEEIKTKLTKLGVSLLLLWTNQ